MTARTDPDPLIRRPFGMTRAHLAGSRSNFGEHGLDMPARIRRHRHRNDPPTGCAAVYAANPTAATNARQKLLTLNTTSLP
jgi:hypothetical protein